MNQAVLNDIDAIIPRLYPPTCAVQFNHCELERTTLAVEKPIISFCAVDVTKQQDSFTIDTVSLRYSIQYPRDTASMVSLSVVLTPFYVQTLLVVAESLQE